MRLKVLIPVLILSAVILAVIFLAHPGRRASLLTAMDSVAKNSITAQNGEVELTTSNSQPTAEAQFHASTNAEWKTEWPSAQERQEEYVASRIVELLDLAMSDDTNSLYQILSELNNRDSRIREAAITAAVQFNSPAAIPALQDACSQTDVPEEKIRLLKAIEFLSVSPEPQAVGQAN